MATSSIILFVFALCFPRNGLTLVTYDNLPVPLPINVPSLGYDATATTQFGNYIQLSTDDAPCAVSATTILSSQAAQTDFPGYGPDGYNWTITIQFYSVNDTNATYPTIDELIYSQSSLFDIPFRPESSPCCSGYDWMDDENNCHSGVAFEITFDLPFGSVILPDSFVVGIAFNTEDAGFAPVLEDGPWDSLNIGLADAYPATGGNVINGTAFVNSTDASTYSDDGARGVGFYRIDYGWEPYTLLMNLVSDNCPDSPCSRKARRALPGIVKPRRIRGA
jgi:hypothetical protein